MWGKVKADGKCSEQGEEFELLGYSWMFDVVSARYQKEQGRAGARMMGHLRNLDQSVKRDLDKGAKNP